jgi:hypothetical protein
MTSYFDWVFFFEKKKYTSRKKCMYIILICYIRLIYTFGNGGRR